MPEVHPALRRALLPMATVLASALLTGCAGSGVYSYWGDTFVPPFGANPNMPPAPGPQGAQVANETYSKIRGRNVEHPTPILYEAGDVWPPAPKAPPTLKDLQIQQNKELTTTGTGEPNYTPLQPLPELPGYEVPQQQAHPVAPRPSFPSGIVNLPSGQRGVITGGDRGVQSLNGPTGNGSIVVPNGNGTSTVIGPNGSVSTIPTPGK